MVVRVGVVVKRTAVEEGVFNNLKERLSSVQLSSHLTRMLEADLPEVQ